LLLNSSVRRWLLLQRGHITLLKDLTSLQLRNILKTIFVNKKQLLLGLGTMVVVVTGFLAGRANAKTVNPGLYYKTSNFGTCKVILNGTSGFTTGVFAAIIIFRTTGGGAIAASALYEDNYCTSAFPTTQHVAVRP